MTKMMKRLMSLMLGMMLVMTCCPALAEENTMQDSGADVLTLSELRELTAELQALAMTSELLNDPASSPTEEGYEFQYSFGMIYADSPVMGIDTQVQAVVLTSAEVQGVRGLQVGDDLSIVLQACYNENASLRGSRETAVLYVLDMLPGCLSWGLVKRDGQRVQTVEYAVHERMELDGEGYSDAGVIFTMTDNVVSAIRLYGMTGRISEETVTQVRDEMYVEELFLLDDYVQVPSSYIGSELTMFDGTDLQFSGLDFMGLTPDNVSNVLGEVLDDVWMENGDAGYVRTMSFADCDVSFLYDAQKLAPRIYMLVIAQDGMEGPRATRIGDSLMQVYNRFRNGEGAEETSGREWLYGDEDSGVYGVVDYAPDAAVMRYSLVLETGAQVVLNLTFSSSVLEEIMLYVE